MIFNDSKRFIAFNLKNALPKQLVLLIELNKLKEIQMLIVTIDQHEFIDR